MTYFCCVDNTVMKFRRHVSLATRFYVKKRYFLSAHLSFTYFSWSNTCENQPVIRVFCAENRPQYRTITDLWTGNIITINNKLREIPFLANLFFRSIKCHSCGEHEIAVWFLSIISSTFNIKQNDRFKPYVKRGYDKCFVLSCEFQVTIGDSSIVAEMCKMKGFGSQQVKKGYLEKKYSDLRFASCSGIRSVQFKFGLYN